MNNPLQSQLTHRVNFVISTLKTFHKLWLIPAVVGFALALIYIFLLRTESWSATQALSVRDDLSGQAFKPGRFDSIESMKSAQETILEIARKPEVIRNALEQLGPASSGFFGMGQRDWPSEEMIERLQESIVLSAPNGAEFGETEVVKLRTKATTRQRSLQFVKLLLDEIIKATNDFRVRQLQSMQLELLQSRDAAQLTLRESRDNINALDQELGEDLADMKALIGSQTDGVSLKREMSELALEKRTAEQYVSGAVNALSILTDAQLNPQQVVNMSADLTSYVPGIEVLKRELARQTRDLAVNVGKFNDVHPAVQNSKAAIEEMKNQINHAIESAIPALSQEIEAKQQLIVSLQEKIGNLRQRLLSLTDRRAEVMILEANAREATEMVAAIQSRLGEVEARLNSNDSGLITPVGNPQVATRPDGLGKKVIVLAGTMAGLMIGLGMVMLVAPPMDPTPVTDNNSSPRDPSENDAPSQVSPEPTMTPVPAILPNVELKQRVGVDMKATQNSTTFQASQQPVQASVQPQPLDAELPGEVETEDVQVDEPQLTAVDVSRTQEMDDFFSEPSEDDIDASEPIADISPSLPASPDSAPAQREPVEHVAPTAQATEPNFESSLVDNQIEQEEPVDNSFENNDMETGEPVAETVDPIAETTDSVEEPEPVLENVDEDLPQTPVDQTLVLEQTTSPSGRVEPATMILTDFLPGATDTVAAESSETLQTQILDTEMQQRLANTRPVDLTKSLEQESLFVRVEDSNSTEQATTDLPVTGSSNPFLKRSIDSDSSTSTTDQTPAEEPVTPEAEPVVPIPEQIRRLNESVTYFSNPVERFQYDDTDGQF